MLNLKIIKKIRFQLFILKARNIETKARKEKSYMKNRHYFDLVYSWDTLYIKHPIYLKMAESHNLLLPTLISGQVINLLINGFSMALFLNIKGMRCLYP